METSAKDTINIDELFINTTKHFLERQIGSVNKKDTKVLKGSKSISAENETPNKKEKKKKCCK